MTEDKLDQFIRGAARDYNRPPEILPREQMWGRIQESRREASAAPFLRIEGAHDATRPSAVQLQVWKLAAAAGILLAAGAGIGRLSRSAPSTVAMKEAQPANIHLNPEAPRNPTTVEQASALPSERDTKIRPAASAVRLQVTSSHSSQGVRRPSREIDARRTNATYQVASVQHLAATEALLTAFRSDSVNRAMDPVIAKWSRELLSNTRLLLDSPAARDPVRKHLLEDLELVLTQIVQLSNTPNAGERDMVEGTIREGHVMTRLRTAIPADRPQGT